MNQLTIRAMEAPAITPAAQSFAQPELAERHERSRPMSAPPSLASAGIRQSIAPRLQPKLRVSHPADSAEAEADRVADAVMSMPSPAATTSAINRDTEAQRACASCEGEEAQRAAVDEDEAMKAQRAAVDEDEAVKAQRAAVDEDEAVARKGGGSVPEVTPDVESDIRSARSSGAPLPAPVRSFFEPRLGADLGGVRVHTGSQAASAARKLDARAFTIGRDITFGAGQYDPSSSAGKRLIAHELVHTVQQGGARRREP